MPSATLRVGAQLPVAARCVPASSRRSQPVGCASLSSKDAGRGASFAPSSTLARAAPLSCAVRGRGLTASRLRATPVAAAAAAEAEALPPAKQSGLGDTLYLGLLFGLWYAANILFNIWNKQVLKAYNFPITGTFVQFGIGLLIASAMWLLRLKAPPKVDKDVLIGVLPLAVVHTLGNLLTNISLGAVSVSFTHTIKAMEPFFSVILSWGFLGSVPSAPLLLTLLPIVGGVALASFSEPTFNWGGFAAAMGSNLTFQSRNVLSKKLMGGAKGIKKGSMDNINLFSLITIASFFLTIPVVLAVEGVRFTPAAMAAAGVNVDVVVKRTLLAGVCFHAYQQVSYMILQRVSPVTHSVGNCVKRVIVIVSSVIFFRTPVTPINAAGTALALAGVFAYSRVTASKGKKSE